MSLSDVCKGNRIVNLKEFWKNLKCEKCKAILDFDKASDETRLGLLSIFRIFCDKRGIFNEVRTSKMHKSETGTYSDVNLTAVLGKRLNICMYRFLFT